MARLHRTVLPGFPHHVTQRSNRRERTFFEDGDYALYLDLLADAAGRHGVEIWSYCLIPNRVHVIALPRDPDGLSRTFRHVHRHYTGYVKARMRVTGHLWQGRFSSVAMDDQHLCAAFRYVALNLVCARLVAGDGVGGGVLSRVLAFAAAVRGAVAEEEVGAFGGHVHGVGGGFDIAGFGLGGAALWRGRGA